MREKNWSQIDVAKKIGITNAVLSNYERNHRDRDSKFLCNISRSLKCIDGLSFGRAEKPSPQLEIDFQEAVHHASIQSPFMKRVSN